jgi:outer membrane scaffolding protein for murein synthesis (MipA/OmpV family)
MNSNTRSLAFFVRLVGLLLALCATMPVTAYHLPHWEWGVGIATLRLPPYRGAAEQDVYALPIPYITYRGEHFRMDEEGVRGSLFHNDRLRLDLSIAGNVPVSADGDGPRAGMPALKSVGELGSTLDISLWRHGRRHKGETQLWLQLPVRAALAVGNPFAGKTLVAHQGWVFSPTLDLNYQQGTPRSFWSTSLSLGPLFATRRYHDYFYTVPIAFVTSQRPAYRADGGYSGTRTILTLAVHTRRWFVGAFARYDWLDGAVFEDSPLLETRRYFALGLAVSWIFATSDGRATH